MSRFSSPCAARLCLVGALANLCWLLGDAVGQSAATMIVVALGS